MTAASPASTATPPAPFTTASPAFSAPPKTPAASKAGQGAKTSSTALERPFKTATPPPTEAPKPIHRPNTYLKTTNKIARATANKRNAIHIDPHGLPHIPTPVFRWAMGRTLPNIPPISFSAKGYGRSLTGWIASNVTQCHACEFSIYHPAGFAGTADALISVSGETLESHGETPDLRGAPFVADWKTSTNRRSPEMLADYRLQAGAYSLGLEHLTGIKPAGAFIVVARRAGPPDITFMNRDALSLAEDGYLQRCRQFYEAIQGAG
jgi:hypothetical protein